MAYRSRIVFVYVNVIWMKNLMVCFGIGLVTYHQGALYKLNKDFCEPYDSHNIAYQKAWVHSRSSPSIQPLLDVCIFGTNNHNLNSIMDIKQFQNELVSFTSIITNFPPLAQDASTKPISDYDSTVLKTLPD